MKRTEIGRTQVAITIDTEFSIGGAFDDFETNKPLVEPVECRVGDRSHGLGFLLEVFRRYAIDATFFVEAIHTRYFGFEPMRQAIEQIRRAGHDVQLHIHPCWMAFQNGELVGRTEDINDSCAGRDPEQLQRIFEIGLDAFRSWDLPKPVAFRPGSFEADLGTYSVMKAAGIPLASNLNMALRPQDDPQLRASGGSRWIQGVLELPVLCFRDMPLLRSSHYRPLQITSCSFPEMRAVLRAARRSGVRTVVVLTHPFEFIKKRDFRYRELTRNRVNQRRLERLCDFIRQHDDEFEAVSFGAAAERWLERGATEAPHIRTSDVLAITRMFHNRLNDAVWPY